jgi:hypothetical protein
MKKHRYVLNNIKKAKFTFIAQLFHVRRARLPLSAWADRRSGRPVRFENHSKKRTHGWIFEQPTGLIKGKPALATNG